MSGRLLDRGKFWLKGMIHSKIQGRQPKHGIMGFAGEKLSQFHVSCMDNKQGGANSSAGHTEAGVVGSSFLRFSEHL